MNGKYCHGFKTKILNATKELKKSCIFFEFLNDDKDDVVDDKDDVDDVDEGEYDGVDSDNLVVCFIATL